MTASRRPTRLVIAGIAVGIGTALALAGCSSGMITQTAEQTAPVPGANAQAGQISLRNLVIEYSGPAGYPAGGNAALVVRLFNDGASPVTLVGVTTDKADSVQLLGTPEVLTPVETPPPAATTSPATQSPAPEGSATESPSPTATASPTATTRPAAPISVTIPAQGYALLVPGQGTQGYLQLTGLTEPVAPGYQVEVTFTFSDGTSATVPVPLAPPTGIVPRATPVVEPEHAEPVE